MDDDILNRLNRQWYNENNYTDGAICSKAKYDKALIVFKNLITNCCFAQNLKGEINVELKKAILEVIEIFSN